MTTERNTVVETDQGTPAKQDELRDDELDSVNGGRGNILLAAAGAVVDAVFDAVVIPIIRAV